MMMCDAGCALRAVTVWCVCGAPLLRIDLNRDGSVRSAAWHGGLFMPGRFFRAAGVGRGNRGLNLHPFSPSGRVRAQPAVAGAIRGQLVTANRRDRLHKRHLSTDYMQFRAAAGLAGPIRAGGPSGVVYFNQDW